MNKTLRFLFAIIFVVMTFSTPQPVYAAGIVVNTDTDNLTDDGLCTLREAVINANNDAATHDDCTAGAGDDVITFNLTGCPCTITLIGSQININSNMTITGIGASNLAISGAGTNQIFTLNTSRTLNLSGVTITGGSNPSGHGGGIFTNSASTLNISDSVISGNSAQHGGGIFTQAATLILLNTTVSNNTASGDGGGIYANSAVSTTIINSTFTGNSATGLGIAIVASATVNIRNSTIANNTAGGGTNGIFSTGTITLWNTIVSNSSCSVTVTNGGNNIDSGTTCGFGSANNSQSSTDPMLNPLANNGGNTPTMSLQTGSPAIDAGNNATCESADQRGVSRPQGTTCDIGAYELIPPSDISVSIGGNVMGTYTLAANTSQVLKYPVTGGPVVISGSPGSNIIASLNQWRRLGAGTPWTGVAQSMAIPIDLITDTYVMPRYVGNDPTLYNAILMANVDTVSRDITVTIEGNVMGTYTLGPSESEFVVYDGVVGGPVVVSSDSGAQIVASLYELKRGSATTTYNGQSEMNGLPFSQLSDTYLIPIYFGNPVHVGLDAKIFIANADGVARDITVSIGGNVMGTYTLEPNTSQSLKYPVTGGPVEISGPSGSNIIASLNQWRRLGAGTPFTGVAQSMAIPAELITNQYAIPRYVGNDPTLYNAILLANVDTVSRDITVTIGGTAINDVITLGPSESEFVVYDGVVGGPVVVSSDSGAQIVASLYELKRGSATTTYNGQSEMNGLPFSQLSDTYLIPIYFGNPIHIGLDAKIFIAVP